MKKHVSRRRREGIADPSILPDESELNAAGHRHGRLQQILREELDALVRNELNDPALDGVIITSVVLSVDYRNARVQFWIMRATPPSRDAWERLERLFARAAPFLRASLADAVDLKQVPTLRFVWDQGAAEHPGIQAEAMGADLSDDLR